MPQTETHKVVKTAKKIIERKAEATFYKEGERQKESYDFFMGINNRNFIITFRDETIYSEPYNGVFIDTDHQIVDKIYNKLLKNSYDEIKKDFNFTEDAKHKISIWV